LSDYPYVKRCQRRTNNSALFWLGMAMMKQLSEEELRQR
jgi:hypothetical protein